MSSSQIQSGSFVQVAIRDIVCPDLLEMRQWVGPDFIVTGRVTFFSDSGMNNNQFAILSVDGLRQPVITPVSRLSLLKSGTRVHQPERKHCDLKKRSRAC